MWVCKSSLTLIFHIWKGQELRRNILLHGELLTFNKFYIHVPEKGHVLTLVICGTSGNVHVTPRNPLFLTLETPDYLKRYKESHIILKRIVFRNLKISKQQGSLERCFPFFEDLTF